MSSTSRCEETSAPRALEGLVDELSVLETFFLLDQGEPCADIEVEICARLLGSAVRLFVAAANAAALDDDKPLPRFDLTPTHAVVAAATLLRDQDLTPFDLTLWFQRIACEAKRSNSFNEAKYRAAQARAQALP